MKEQHNAPVFFSLPSRVYACVPVAQLPPPPLQPLEPFLK